MLANFVNWFLGLSADLGYLGVAALMAVESSFIPFPSEAVVPPAAYLASQGHFNIWLVILAGIVGSLIGAIFNYYLALYLGRPLVYRLVAKPWAKFFLLSPEKIDRAERYFLANGRSATFIGRLVPVIRQLISLPAGFSRMPFGQFLLYTFLGSGLWVSILAALGYFIGAHQERLSLYYHEISWGLLAVGLVWLGYVIWRRLRGRKASPPAPSGR